MVQELRAWAVVLNGLRFESGLFLISCVTKLLHLSGPHFPLQSSGNQINSSFKIVLQRVKEIAHVIGVCFEGMQGGIGFYYESYIILY